MHADDNVRFPKDGRHFARALLRKLAARLKHHPPFGCVAKGAVQVLQAMRSERAQLKQTEGGK